jgi:hypothetical protein
VSRSHLSGMAQAPTETWQDRTITATASSRSRQSGERVRLRIGSPAKAVLETGQAYQDPKDALNEFVSNPADEYIEADRHPDYLLVKDDEASLLDYLATLVAKEYVLFKNPRAGSDDLSEGMVRMLVRVRRHVPRRR